MDPSCNCAVQPNEAPSVRGMCPTHQAAHNVAIDRMRRGPPVPPSIPEIPDTLETMRRLAAIYRQNQYITDHTTPTTQDLYRRDMELVRAYRPRLIPHLDRLVWEADRDALPEGPIHSLFYSGLKRGLFLTLKEPRG